jgi:cobalt-zinc-cadmium efflux system protein
LLRDSLAMSVDAVPASIDPQAVRSYLSSCPGVAAVHDLHIWPLSTTESALTAHLVFPDGHPGDEFLLKAATELRQRFGIGHTTLQIESARKPPAISRPITSCEAVAFCAAAQLRSLKLNLRR